MSAKKCKGGRTGDGGAYIKPLLVQAAWAAVRVPGRLQARFRRLVRKFGGPRNKGAQKRAITAIAHTLLKIAYSVLKTGKPYADLGADSTPAASSPSPQRRLPDGPGLIPDRPPGRGPAPSRRHKPPLAADARRKAPNFASAEGLLHGTCRLEQYGGILSGALTAPGPDRRP
jgi:hypothetical protein